MTALVSAAEGLTQAIIRADSHALWTPGISRHELKGVLKKKGARVVEKLTGKGIRRGTRETGSKYVTRRNKAQI